MIANSMRRAFAALAVLAMLAVAVEANAACCGGGATTAYYPSTYSAYYPTQTYSTGWYPGYFLDRVRARLWGSPSTYVAAYPTTTYYAPTYSASYAPTYSASYAAPAAVSYAAPASSCSTCTAGYAPACSSCVQQVTMRPVCTTACAPCATCCPTCPVASGVTQTSYVQQQPPCATCAAAQGQQQPQQGAASTTREPDPAPTSTYDPSSTSSSSTGAGGAPQIDPSANVPVERTERQPVEESPAAQPGPGDDTPESTETDTYDPYKVKESDSSTYFEAPKLHDPNDRTAKRSIAPVKTALYKQPATYRSVSSTGRITAAQAQADAAGWSSN